MSATVITTDKEVKIITTQTLTEILMAETKPLFVWIKMKTPHNNHVKTSKIDGTINPYYKQLYKVTEKRYKLVTDYSKRVQNNRTKEENNEVFVVEAPKGKKHLSPCVLTDTATETKFYLMLEWFPEVKGTTEFLHNNDPIALSLFEKWVVNYDSNNAKQDIERTVNVITVNIDNILEMSLNGVRYVR
jgi:hypothetical protein